MKEYRASTTIKAPPEQIWAILTDGAAYPEWEPNTIRIEGRIAQGEKLTAYSKLSPDRAFPVKVTEFVPGQKMTWSGGMPLGLFKGERSFTLTPRGDGATEFTLREVFSGALLGVIGRTLPNLNTAFAQFAASLKDRAERVATSA
jgi:hypothetical protein